MGNAKAIRAAKAAEKEALSQLLTDINEVKAMLIRAFHTFNDSLEPELVEASVYEINALQSKHAYLLRKIKEHGITDVRAFALSGSCEAAGLPKGSR
jgi:hypothetical protein